jgi:hypothetical protein
MLDYLESEVLRGGFAIGIFLDIERAFNNLLPEGVLKSLEKRGTPAKLLSWFKNYLLTRKVKVEYQGTTTSQDLVKGKPQGGVLSPVLWNLAFDEVLKLFDSGPIKVCGYADDLVLIGCGKDPASIVGNLQQLINRVLDWGCQRGLKFSASKSVAVTFMRRRKWHCPRLQMDSNDYLGPSAEKHANIRAGNAWVSPPHGSLLTRRSGQNMDPNK